MVLEGYQNVILNSFQQDHYNILCIHLWIYYKENIWHYVKKLQSYHVIFINKMILKLDITFNIHDNYIL